MWQPLFAAPARHAYDCNHMTKNPPIPPALQRDAAAEALLPLLGDVVPALRVFEAGAVLFRQGDATRGIFRLVSGRVRLTRTTAAGAEVAMHTVRPGELFAEASMFSRHYHCDAIALCASEVLCYRKADLMQALRQDPDALWAFAGELAHRVQTLRARLELQRIRAAPERVLQALRLRCDVAGRWPIDGTLKNLAEEIGLTHEALYRALAQLERDGAITRSAQEIALTRTARG